MDFVIGCRTRVLQDIVEYPPLRTSRNGRDGDSTGCCHDAHGERSGGSSTGGTGRLKTERRGRVTRERTAADDPRQWISAVTPTSRTR
jgi:hypothetical protein